MLNEYSEILTAEGLNDVIAFVQNQFGEIEERKEWTPETTQEDDTKVEIPENKPEEKSILGSLLNKLKN